MYSSRIVVLNILEFIIGMLYAGTTPYAGNAGFDIVTVQLRAVAVAVLGPCFGGNLPSLVGRFVL